MDIPYVVIAADPINEHETRVVVETLLPQVVNGYGGGRLTFIAPNATLQQAIEAKVLWKLGVEAPAYKHSGHQLIGNLTKIQAILDSEEVRRDTKRARLETDGLPRVKADASPTPGAPAVVKAVVESVTKGETPSVMKER